MVIGRQCEDTWILVDRQALRGYLDQRIVLALGRAVLGVAALTCWLTKSDLSCACRYVYVVPTCPKGMRRAVVLLRGRGQGCSRRGTVGDLAAAAQPSLGPAISSGGSSSGGSDESSGSSGGVRFACAQLAFIRRDEVDGLGADDCLAGWQDRVVQGA